MFRYIVVVCVLLAAAKGQSTNVNRCLVSPAELPLKAHVHGCVHPPCQLPQLQDLMVDVLFRAPRTISNMTTLATVSIHFIIDISFPHQLGDNAKTCDFLTDTRCPVLEGELVQYRLKMFIDQFFPVGTLATLEFKIVDNDRNNEAVWCIRFPFQVVRPAPAIADANEGQNQTPVQVVN